MIAQLLNGFTLGVGFAFGSALVAYALTAYAERGRK